MLKQLQFDKDGLIPAIIQDYYSKQVLTVAYMNRESLKISIKEKRTCFYSRSRQELWRKGETSGHYQHIVSIKADCDQDALLIEVIKDGPACHLGGDSCFSKEIFNNPEIKDFSLEALYALIKGRKLQPQEGSYTTYLFDKGLDKILKKVGEECTEVVIAAKDNDHESLVYEICDLIYHNLVLMIEKDITLDELIDELAKRHIVDHKVKQERLK